MKNKLSSNYQSYEKKRTANSRNVVINQIYLHKKATAMHMVQSSSGLRTRSQSLYRSSYFTLCYWAETSWIYLFIKNQKVLKFQTLLHSFRSSLQKSKCFNRGEIKFATIGQRYERKKRRRVRMYVELNRKCHPNCQLREIMVS